MSGPINHGAEAERLLADLREGMLTHSGAPVDVQLAIAQNPVIGRIEVIRPGGDDVVGYFEREMGAVADLSDAWFGFIAGGDS